MANGLFTFPTKWENKGHTKTVMLLLNMTEPLYCTRKVVTGDSGFFLAESVVALHEKGVYGQEKELLAIGVPGDFINNHMV